MDQPDLPETVIPLKFVMKFEPPLIGLMYKRGKKENKKYIYNILLNDLLALETPEQITKQLFVEHSHFLNPSKVAFDQVQSLVIKLIEYLIALQEMNEANEMEQGDDQQDFQMNEEEMQDYYRQQAEQQKPKKSKKGMAAEW